MVKFLVFVFVLAFAFFFFFWNGKIVLKRITLRFPICS